MVKKNPTRHFRGHAVRQRHSTAPDGARTLPRSGTLAGLGWTGFDGGDSPRAGPSRTTIQDAPLGAGHALCNMLAVNLAPICNSRIELVPCMMIALDATARSFCKPSTRPKICGVVSALYSSRSCNDALRRACVHGFHTMGTSVWADCDHWPALAAMI